MRKQRLPGATDPTAEFEVGSRVGICMQFLGETGWQTIPDWKLHWLGRIVALPKSHRGGDTAVNVQPDRPQGHSGQTTGHPFVITPKHEYKVEQDGGDSEALVRFVLLSIEQFMQEAPQEESSRHT